MAAAAYSGGPPATWNYDPPASWKNPVVGHKNLLVSTDHLRTVARSLDTMANDLADALTTWKVKVAPASEPTVTGSWHAAAQLRTAIQQNSDGVSTFVQDMVTVSGNAVTQLIRTASHYDDHEHATIKDIADAAHGRLATRVQSGGHDLRPHLHAGHEQRGGEKWNGAVEVTANAPFTPGSVAGLTWQHVESMLEATDPDAITAAGEAYKPLRLQLSLICKQLSRNGETLAENWSGPAAVTAVSQFQMLHQTAAGLHENAYWAGGVLSWYGPVLKFNKRIASRALSAAPPAAANTTARQLLKALNQQISVAYELMPATVRKNLPKVSGPKPTASGPVTPSQPPLAQTVPGTEPSVPPQPWQPVLPPPPAPVVLAGGVGTLPLAPPGGVLPAGGALPVGGVPAGGVPAGVPAVPGIVPEIPAVPGSSADADGGAAGPAAAATGAEGGAAADGEFAGFPFAGGPGTGDNRDKDRRRSAWDAEEADDKDTELWGSSAGEAEPWLTADGVITGHMPGSESSDSPPASEKGPEAGEDDREAGEEDEEAGEEDEEDPDEPFDLRELPGIDIRELQELFEGL